jgi:hypothetical protein
LQLTVHGILRRGGPEPRRAFRVNPTPPDAISRALGDLTVDAPLGEELLDHLNPLIALFAESAELVNQQELVAERVLADVRQRLVGNRLQDVRRLFGQRRKRFLQQERLAAARLPVDYDAHRLAHVPSRRHELHYFGVALFPD